MGRQNHLLPRRPSPKSWTIGQKTESRIGVFAVHLPAQEEQKYLLVYPDVHRPSGRPFRGRAIPAPSGHGPSAKYRTVAVVCFVYTTVAGSKRQLRLLSPSMIAREGSCGGGVRCLQAFRWSWKKGYHPIRQESLRIGRDTAHADIKIARPNPLSHHGARSQPRRCYQ